MAEEQDSSIRIEHRKLTLERWLLFAILGVFLTGLPAILTYPAERILFNPQSYKQALAEQSISEQYPQYVGQLIAEGGNALLFGSGSQLLGVLERSHYDVIMQEIIPGEWVQVQANSLIDQFWAFFNFHSPQFELVVDFRAVKARLNGSETPQLAAQIVQGFPPCQQDDILKFGAQLLQGQVDRLPLCKPPEMFLGAANLLVEETLRGAAQVMPDQLDLASILWLPEVLGGKRVSAAWRLGFSVYRAGRQVDAILPWLALILLAVTGWLARRTYRGPVHWLGIALVLPGMTALFAVLMLWLLSSVWVPLLIQQLFGSNSPILFLLVNIFKQVTGQYAVWTAVTAWLVTIVGAGLLAADFWVWRKPGSSQLPPDSDNEEGDRETM